MTTLLVFLTAWTAIAFPPAVMVSRVLAAGSVAEPGVRERGASPAWSGRMLAFLDDRCAGRAASAWAGRGSGVPRGFGPSGPTPPGLARLFRKVVTALVTSSGRAGPRAGQP